jgi:hypothetical protein
VKDEEATGGWGGGVNGSLMKFFHKKAIYVTRSKSQTKPLKEKDEKTLTNRIKMILTKV